MAACQDAAMGADAALDLRARKIQRDRRAELHAGVLLLMIMGVVIIEECGRGRRIRRKGMYRLVHQRIHSGVVGLRARH